MNLENLSEVKEKLISFEKKIAKAFKEEKVSGPVHFSRGNEEQVIKIFRGLRSGDYIFKSSLNNYFYSREELINKKLIVVDDKAPASFFDGIKKNDWICTSYRNHYHALLKGIPEKWLEEQITDGNSMHIFNKDYKFFTSAIVAGQVPIALGISKALKLKNSKDRVWVFCGDMGAESGVFYESTKYAYNHKLPINFIIEDNGLGVNTPTEAVWGGSNALILPNVIRYPYLSEVPHQGVGKEVGF